MPPTDSAERGAHLVDRTASRRSRSSARHPVPDLARRRARACVMRGTTPTGGRRAPAQPRRSRDLPRARGEFEVARVSAGQDYRCGSARRRAPIPGGAKHALRNRSRRAGREHRVSTPRMGRSSRRSPHRRAARSSTSSHRRALRLLERTPEENRRWASNERTTDVGPAAGLRDHGRAPIVDSPGIGRGLDDRPARRAPEIAHPAASRSATALREEATTRDLALGGRAGLRGPLSSGGARGGWLIRRSAARALPEPTTCVRAGHDGPCA